MRECQSEASYWSEMIVSAAVDDYEADHLDFEADDLDETDFE